MDLAGAVFLERGDPLSHCSYSGGSWVGPAGQRPGETAPTAGRVEVGARCPHVGGVSGQRGNAAEPDGAALEAFSLGHHLPLWQRRRKEERRGRKSFLSCVCRRRLHCGRHFQCRRQPLRALQWGGSGVSCPSLPSWRVSVLSSLKWGRQ